MIIGFIVLEKLEFYETSHPHTFTRHYIQIKLYQHCLAPAH